MGSWLSDAVSSATSNFQANAGALVSAVESSPVINANIIAPTKALVASVESPIENAVAGKWGLAAEGALLQPVAQVVGSGNAAAAYLPSNLQPVVKLVTTDVVNTVGAYFGINNAGTYINALAAYGNSQGIEYGYGQGPSQASSAPPVATASGGTVPAGTVLAVPPAFDALTLGGLGALGVAAYLLSRGSR